MKEENFTQDLIDFIEDTKEIMGKCGECDTETVIDILLALDSELEIYNVEMANG